MLEAGKPLGRKENCHPGNREEVCLSSLNRNIEGRYVLVGHTVAEWKAWGERWREGARAGRKLQAGGRVR